jgi:alpha-galactosidase
MTFGGNPSQAAHAIEAVAQYIDHDLPLNAARPAAEWGSAIPFAFCEDWRAQNPDQQRETQVRLLWNFESLYLRFQCRYRDVYVFDDADQNGRRDHLWDRDVAEAFLQPDASRPRFYREFEVSPNGMWIDLDISPAGLADLKSGMKRSVILNEKEKTWVAELAIPMPALTTQFDPKNTWRANFFRVEGLAEPRTYMAWRPTYTPEPNFHVPEAFGILRFHK